MWTAVTERGGAGRTCSTLIYIYGFSCHNSVYLTKPVMANYYSMILSLAYED